MDGGELKTLRLAAGLTQEHMAALLSVDPQTVSRWETRRHRIRRRTSDKLLALLADGDLISKVQALTDPCAPDCKKAGILGL